MAHENEKIIEMGGGIVAYVVTQNGKRKITYGIPHKNDTVKIIVSEEQDDGFFVAKNIGVKDVAEWDNIIQQAKQNARRHKI